MISLRTDTQTKCLSFISIVKDKGTAVHLGMGEKIVRVSCKYCGWPFPLSNRLLSSFPGRLHSSICRDGTRLHGSSGLSIPLETPYSSSRHSVSPRTLLHKLYTIAPIWPATIHSLLLFTPFPILSAHYAPLSLHRPIPQAPQGGKRPLSVNSTHPCPLGSGRWRTTSHSTPGTRQRQSGERFGLSATECLTVLLPPVIVLWLLDVSAAMCIDIHNAAGTSSLRHPRKPPS